MNFYIKVNDTILPTPSTFEVTIQDYDSSEAGRNSTGQLFRDRITVKEKVAISWKVLDAQQMKTILNAVTDVFFTVEYFSPKLADYRTATMYVGDRTVTAYTFSELGVKYTDFGISLIER